MWQVPCYNEHSPSVRLSHLEEPTPLDRAEISGDYNDFYSTNGALRAVKGTDQRNQSHVDLTWKNPRHWIELIFG
jgi:hypothetical protein